MKRKTISMRKAGKIVGRLRNVNPGFEGPDLVLVVRYHRHLNGVALMFAIMAVSSMWNFSHRWETTLMFFAMFGVFSFYARQLNRIRELFEQSALQNLNDLAAKEGHA